ncbi:MAG: helix-turn-helix domain-containing protein [Alicyclobacillus herbarius]|uniref:helix-turn-helix domain-containing protein n=1 Tax=Alicyclobacillus herbarius TaxID=122960 RepID=UPI000401A600|nr:helix-turn-helix transcriptional regulator [Alicyclobacillus herbarius]MCL6631191.1 helix-turn-helix domain-containing protein [Alicyclobacillus herbarius]
MLGIGTQVKKLRLERQLTVRQLAKRAGVSVSYVYAVESGKRGSNLSKLERIAQALEVPLTALWDEGRD